MNKAFSLFLMVALILGGSLGGAFASGVALGKTQGETPSEAQAAGSFSQGPGERSGGDRPQGRGQGARSGGGFQRGGQGAGSGGDQRIGQSGPESRGSRQGEGDRQGFDGGFRGGPGEDSGGGGRRGGRGVGGAIESIEGNTLTVTTPRGPVTVTTGGDTTVRKIVDGSLEDLEQGAQIRVTGQRDEEGIVKATSITLIPEGAQEFIGRRGPRQER
ncbi:MAG TPA: hypothetical protein EYM54_05625 [Dehalococcoidia bacterium]|nr:hypothetical protein [Dehalococcoidia bacterium]